MSMNLSSILNLALISGSSVFFSTVFGMLIYGFPNGSEQSIVLFFIILFISLILNKIEIINLINDKFVYSYYESKLDFNKNSIKEALKNDGDVLLEYFNSSAYIILGLVLIFPLLIFRKINNFFVRDLVDFNYNIPISNSTDFLTKFVQFNFNLINLIYILSILFILSLCIFFIKRNYDNFKFKNIQLAKNITIFYLYKQPLDVKRFGLEISNFYSIQEKRKPNFEIIRPFLSSSNFSSTKFIIDVILINKIELELKNLITFISPHSNKSISDIDEKYKSLLEIGINCLGNSFIKLILDVKENISLFKNLQKEILLLHDFIITDDNNQLKFSPDIPINQDVKIFKSLDSFSVIKNDPSFSAFGILLKKLKINFTLNDNNCFNSLIIDNSYLNDEKISLEVSINELIRYFIYFKCKFENNHSLIQTNDINDKLDIFISKIVYKSDFIKFLEEISLVNFEGNLKNQLFYVKRQYYEYYNHFINLSKKYKIIFEKLGL